MNLLCRLRKERRETEHAKPRDDGSNRGLQGTPSKPRGCNSRIISGHSCPFAPAGIVHPIPRDVAVSSIVAGAAPARCLIPPGARADRAVRYLHGGGYSVGSVVSHGELAARVGRASESRVLFLDYRLAPENPFPAAVDDAVAAIIGFSHPGTSTFFHSGCWRFGWWWSLPVNDGGRT